MSCDITPLELHEDSIDLVAGDKDQRVPGDQAGHRGAGEGEIRHGADIEPETGMVTSCHLDHPGRQVDPGRVHAQLMQVGRDPPRPASHVRVQAVARLMAVLAIIPYEQGLACSLDSL
jgi:hypothetical protein